eukprot:Skav208582  [mRNA]  locus=scaffold3325:300993:303845:+ [translate_table: standard]
MLKSANPFWGRPEQKVLALIWTHLLGLLGLCFLEVFHEVDSPEILSQLWVANVLIGHVEVTLVTPIFTPGVSHNEDLLKVIEANGSHCMTTTNLVPWLGHEHLASFHHLLITEAGQDGEAKDKGIAVLDARLHLTQILCNTCIALHFALLTQLIALLLRLSLEEGGTIVILPHALRAHTQLFHDFDSISNHGSSILVHAALNIPLVVVDEEPAGSEVFELRVALNTHLVKGEVEGCCQGICRTAAQMTLIEDWEATVLRPQVHMFFVSLLLFLDMAGGCNRLEGHVEIAVIRKIRNPSELLH